MTKLQIPDMSCGHCVATITKAVTAADPGATVVADLASKSVRIETRLPDAALLEALADIGYPATVSR